MTHIGFPLTEYDSLLFVKKNEHSAGICKAQSLPYHQNTLP